MALFLVIYFSSHKYLYDVLVRVLFYLAKPVLHIVKRTLVRRIIGKDYSTGTFVVALRNRSKPFLASRVPDLKLDAFPVNINVLHLEVDS